MMWLFGKKNHQTPEEPEKKPEPAQLEEPYLTIAATITQNDAAVLADMQEGFADPQGFLEKHYEYLPEAMQQLMNDWTTDKWWLLSDILERHNYICKRDWKDELQDFLGFLFQTRRAVQEKLELDQLSYGLLPEGEIPEWSALLDERLKEKDLVVGNLVQDADEYAVFLCTPREMEILQECAATIDQTICCAKEG